LFITKFLFAGTTFCMILSFLFVALNVFLFLDFGLRISDDSVYDFVISSYPLSFTLDLASGSQRNYA